MKIENFIYLACLNLTVLNATSTCLYCRRADKNTSITSLESYSYCQASDTCLKDKWLYIFQTCSSDWSLGRKLSLDYCTPTTTTCHSFTSTSVAAGQFFNYTESLAAGEKCTVTIDASAFVGKVAFDNSDVLGVEYDKYKIGELIEVAQGSSQTFTVYNGDSSGGMITFTLAFTQSLILKSILALTLFVPIVLMNL